MQDLGVFHSLGALWLRVLNELETKGTEAVYTDNAGESAAVRELLYLTAEVQNAALPDAIIEKHKVQAEYDWMVRNFTVQEEVPELIYRGISFLGYDLEREAYERLTAELEDRE